MSKHHLVITILTAWVVVSLGLVQSGHSYTPRNQLTIERGMTLEDILYKGLQIAILVGQTGQKGAPSYEVSAFAVPNTYDPISDIENFISTFGTDGFGRASNNLYVAFVGDPYLRLFQLGKAVGGSAYDRALKIGSVVEAKPIRGAPFKIGRSLKEISMRLKFVQNPALEESLEYELRETRRGDDLISVYVPKSKTTNIDFGYKRGYKGSTNYDYIRPFTREKPKINYEHSLKKIYDDNLQVALIFVPTDEAASWMEGEPFTVTAFAAGKDYYTTEQVLNHIDSISSFVPDVRFITIKGDSEGRLFQIKKHWSGEWVIHCVQDKSTDGAPFELVGRLREGDSQHFDFPYDEIKFVLWYTAERGRTWAAYVGLEAVPVSYAKGISYTPAEKLFKMSI